MNDPMHPSDHAFSGRPSRRDALRIASSGFGMMALGGLGLGAGTTPPHLLGAPRLPRGKAKRVIFLCMSGAPSHVDTFDHKPALTANTGKTLSGVRRGSTLLGSPWKFNPSGKSGLMISELFPQLAKHADKMCLLNGMHTDVPAHPQAFAKLHTGSFQFVRPSLGSWTLYGLGSANDNLPGFVTLNPPSGNGGAQNYGSAFLPATFQGMRVASGRAGRGRSDASPVEDIKNPRQSVALQRKQLDLVQRLNGEYKRREGAADEIEAVIESYELAFKMQAELPELLDISKERKTTLDAYGIGDAATDAFGRQCLTARHLAEAGVRFIEIGAGGWDHHRNLREDLPASCRKIDRPIAALLHDLAQRRMLDETLVVWSGEFGRTPYAQNGNGRDHNNRGFTSWMAGGGIKGGMAYGSTDEHGIEAVTGRMSIHDWHATILSALGMDHEKLTYPYAGRDFRLTDVHGEVPREIFG